MKRLFLAVALAVLASAAEAQTASYVFATVDAVRIEYAYLYVTGVVEGEASPREIAFSYGSAYVEHRQSCERLLLLAMAKPGQYRVRMEPWSSIAKCTLVRVAP